ncbi:hypothetical protein B296_00030365 [Ensete ventricosum]|uniref:Uncharacterized protein n=1 Tax=Ensete ventricosum TaxID=4639 RepID=A0A426XP18_ENSVE|nr:hypothetical protein B296_00030365 [Ensete ventricosum]
MANTALVFARPVASLVPFGLPWGQYKKGKRTPNLAHKSDAWITAVWRGLQLGISFRPWGALFNVVQRSGRAPLGMKAMPVLTWRRTPLDASSSSSRGGEEGERKGARAAGRDKAMPSIPCSLSDLDSIRNSEEEVMVALDHLPRDATDMIDILKAEQAPLHLWLIIAVGSPSSLPVYFALFSYLFRRPF